MLRFIIQKHLTLIAAFMVSFVFSTIANAIDIQEVKSEGGIDALLVEDYTLPIIALSFSFEGGVSQDIAGKEGTVRLLSALMDEGAGELDSSTYRAKLEELGISVGFSAGGDRFGGSLRTIREDKETAFEMLRLALNEPRFDGDAIERMRDAIRTSIIRAEADPSAIARVKLRETIFADHPYSRPTQGTEESINAITRDDIVAMHRKIFASGSVKIGVVGAISAEELAGLLEMTFGTLPKEANLQEIPEIKPKLGVVEQIDMAVPNASISLVYKGLSRDHPDFFAAHLMNHILGGGTFSSRLYREVREKRGLAYGVSSSISTREQTNFLIAGTSTRAENKDEALRIIKQEFERMAKEGVTQEELDVAKKYVAGAYAINNLDTSGKIARVLVALQTENLGIDYIDSRIQQIEAVTLEDVNRVARELLSVEPTVVTLGPATQ